MGLPKKIPTPLGLLLTIAIVGCVIFFFEHVSRVTTRGAATVMPKNVQFSNVTDTSFTASWSTDSEASGLITIAKPDNTSTSAFDERDTQGNLGSYTTHSVTFRNAKPTTDYRISILSNGQKFENGSTPFSIRTGPTLPANEGSNSLGPAYGNVTTAQNEPASGGLVFLTLDGGQTLSTLVGKSGTWLIPLNVVRSTQLTSYLTSSERITETIQVYYQNDLTSALSDTLNDSPVPVMIVGKSYDFRKQQAKSKDQTIAVLSTTPSVLGSQVSRSVTTTVALISPKENAALTVALPFIAGTGVPGKPVSILIAPAPTTTGIVTVAADGTWQYVPPRPLGEGNHTVTMTAVDTNNKTVRITHYFTILKSGTQVLGDATASATLTPTIGISPAVTVSVTPTPTTVVSSTSSATPSPTVSTTPLPVTGNGAGLIGSIIITGGILLFILGFAF